MHKRSYLLPAVSAGVGSGVGYLGAPEKKKGEGAVRGGMKGLGIGAGAELGALGGLGLAYQGSKHLPVLPGTGKAMGLILALAGAIGGGYAGNKLTNMAIGKPSWDKRSFTLPATGAVGTVLGYRNAPDDYKGEGAFRGGVQGIGTGIGAITGGVGAAALGGSSLGRNVNLNEGQKALTLLTLALLGAGAGGAAGYGISRGALGPASWDTKKKEEATKAPQLSDEEDEDMVTKPASVLLKLAGHVWRKSAAGLPSEPPTGWFGGSSGPSDPMKGMPDSKWPLPAMETPQAPVTAPGHTPPPPVQADASWGQEALNAAAQQQPNPMMDTLSNPSGPTWANDALTAANAQQSNPMMDVMNGSAMTPTPPPAAPALAQTPTPYDVGPQGAPMSRQMTATGFNQPTPQNAMPEITADMLRNFRSGTASDYDPNSWLDRNKMKMLMDNNKGWASNTTARGLGRQPSAGMPMMAKRSSDVSFNIPEELKNILPYIVGAGAGATVGGLATGRKDPYETTPEAVVRKLRNIAAGGIAGAGGIYAAQQARQPRRFSDHLMLSYSPFNN